LVLQNYGTGATVSVWWPEEGKNTTNYYLPIGETEQELFKDISGLTPDGNGVISLYGEGYFIATEDTLGRDDNGNYTYEGRFDNVLLYGIDLNYIGVYVKSRSEDVQKDEDDEFVSGTFINKSIKKLIIDGSCYTKNPYAEIEGKVGYDNYQGTCSNGNHKKKYAGAFSNNPELKEDEVIYGVNGDGTRVTRDMLGAYAFANTATPGCEKDQDNDEYYTGLITKLLGGGPGDGFWFILLPAFVLLLAGGYLGLKGKKKQTN
ncbi:MAG: hypothetical protein IJ999_00415, partial [Clostridia bacterium]|nr:hypothetical protein [Clostridia bacterium]